LKGKSQLIGSISLWNFSKDGTSAEVGYDLSPNFQNKGIMTEALQKVIEYGKNQLNLFYIEAYTHKENMNSIKLLEHNNFYPVQERKDAGNLNNIIYQINCKQN
jgi:ribosomal-protein-alanine N-acetyltransferase